MCSPPPTSRGYTTIRDRALLHPELKNLASNGTPIHLLNCDLEEVDLAYLDLADWRFDTCIIKRASFKGAALENAVFVRCRGAFADFTAAKLAESEFQSSDFNNAIFRGATLSAAEFTNCKLTGANLSEVRSMGIIFRETTLSAARLPRMSFRKTILHKVDLSFADLGNCDFRDSVFEESSLREAHIVDARFEGADLRGADLGGLRLSDAQKFKGASISRSQAGDLLAELGLKVL